jgi:hypothetical protein
MTHVERKDINIRKLYELTEVLIPGNATMPAIKQINGFDALLRTAIRACGYSTEDIVAAVERIPDGVNWDAAKDFAEKEPALFEIASTLASAAYYMAPQVLSSLNFPIDRRHPGDVQDFLKEYETGVLDPVIERGPRFRTV